MSDSKRQQIVAAFDTRLKTILTGGGYNTNLGSNIFEWRVTPLAQDELPGAIWRDTDDSIEVSFQQDVHSLSIQVAVTVAGATSPADARKLIADVTAAVATDTSLGGLAEDAKVTGETIEFDQEERRIAGVVLTFVVEFVTNHMDPYI